ncbi:hypothetical protein DFQ28_000599 [Apophysomyces sp. BC1034]|nr:hypothetical protein DFQ28_000599 [Apophysomyces sp. BC1034]
MRLQGGVKVPTGGMPCTDPSAGARRARERRCVVPTSRRVSRSGAMPEPTVIVRMREDVRARCRHRVHGQDTPCMRAASVFGCLLPIVALKRFSPEPCEERFMSKPTPLFEPPKGSPLYARYHADPHAIPPRIAVALQAMREGRPVILQDDFDRENEADLIVAAEKLTIETMALLIRECSGIVCLCLPDAKIRQLALPQMVPANQSRHGTAFTVSIEARDGVSTGVSAADRLTTIRAAIADPAKPTDIVRPGHVFPLRSQPGGVLARRGHTEGTVELCWLAGLKPAGVLCELMNPDGTMTRGNDVERFAALHGLPMLTIEELVDFRRALGPQGADASIQPTASLDVSLG